MYQLETFTLPQTAFRAFVKLDLPRVERLQFDLLFRTGDDALHERDLPRLDQLAATLIQNPEFKVRLDGYTDARGSDEYNNVLARFRALAVAQALVQRGVAADRIGVFSHGTGNAVASGDDLAYARDRRVSLRVLATHS